MNDRPTPKTNAHYIKHGFASSLDAHWLHFCRSLESDIEEIKELYALDTQFMRAELDEARAALRKVHVDLDCELRDPNGTIWDHAAKLQRENAALRDALRARIGHEFCPECKMTVGAGHYPSCRHYATEREVLQ